jgi:hypothetical protein
VLELAGAAEFRIDSAVSHLTTAHEVRELHRVEVAGQLLVVAWWIVVADIPEVRGLLATVCDGILHYLQKPLFNAVEFAVGGAVTGDQSPQRGESLGWEGLVAMHAPGLAEKLHDALKIGPYEPHDLPPARKI